MRRYGVAAGLLALVLAACTDDEPPSARPSDSAEPTATSSSSPDGRGPTGEPVEPTTEPVVLIRHATSVGSELSERQARMVLRRGLSGRPVLAAPGLPVGSSV